MKPLRPLPRKPVNQPLPRQPLPQSPQQSAYAAHVARWADGCGAEICPMARRCLARGTVPCDVLFVGQSPGDSENVIGQPFVGPAGQLLDRIINESLLSHPLTYAITNMVACLPRDEQGKKTDEPSVLDIESCAPRLQEFVRICDEGGRLKLIVRVGTVARDWLDPSTHIRVKLHRDIEQVHIDHPAGILRDNIANRGLRVQRAVIILRSALERAGLI